MIIGRGGFRTCVGMYVYVLPPEDTEWRRRGGGPPEVKGGSKNMACLTVGLLEIPWMNSSP